MQKLPSPSSFKKRNISIQDTDNQDDNLDPHSWKFYYKLEKEKMAQRECVAMQSGRLSVPSFSPIKSTEVANTGLQSIAENTGTAKKRLIHVSRNDVSTQSQIM